MGDPSSGVLSFLKGIFARVTALTRLAMHLCGTIENYLR
jgi:hypothetical protein